MNVKEKIIRSKIARLRTRGETFLIRRLEDELSCPSPAAPPAEPPKKEQGNPSRLRSPPVADSD